jgi:hypothetical protein
LIDFLLNLFVSDPTWRSTLLDKIGAVASQVLDTTKAPCVLLRLSRLCKLIVRRQLILSFALKRSKSGMRVWLRRSSISAYVVAKPLHSIVESRHIVGAVFKLRVDVYLINVGVGRIDGLAGLYKVVQCFVILNLS